MRTTLRTTRKLTSIGTGLALVAATGCGTAASDQPPPTADPTDTLPSAAPMDETIAGMRTLTGTFGEVTAADGENSVYSPASLAYAFAMLRAGATGETAHQLDEVFGFPGNDVHGVMRQLREDVITTDAPPRDEDDNATRSGGPPPEPIVSLANGLFVQQDISLGPDFLATLSRDYDAAAEDVDFTGGQAKEVIDAWVAERTGGRITELFDEIDRDTVAVLANAVYLKADWQQPFEKNLTREEPFRLADGGSVPVPMMSEPSAEVNYVAGDGWQAVELPYAGGELGMWVLVADDADASPPPLTAETFAALADAEPAPVEIAIPRWDFGSDVDLLATLEKLGLTNLDELPGIAENFFVTDAIHRANITVDEDGTEAAAATGIAGTTSLGPQPEISVRADHPFSFAITHTPTGAPLFAGVVADPTEN